MLLVAALLVAGALVNGLGLRAGAPAATPTEDQPAVAG
jgi:hypothetical protein